MTSLRRSLPAVLLSAFSLASPAAAQTGYNWTGTYSGSWSTFGNWETPTYPPEQPSGPPPSNGQGALVFGQTGTTNTTMTNDYVSNYQIYGLNFYGFSFSLSGLSLALQGPMPQIYVSDSYPVTISTGLTASSNLTVLAGGPGSLALNGPITGAIGLFTSGPGTLSLGGSNSYTGGTNINSGTLVISADANLGAVPPSPTSTGNVSINGGTLSVAVGFTLNANRTITTGPGTATIDVEASQTFIIPGQLQIGTGGLIKTGLGTLVLIGSSGIYNVTISAGTLECSINNVTGALIDNANVTFNQVINGVCMGGLVGTGTASKIGAGILTLAGANSYQGGSIVSGGTVSFSADNQLGMAGSPVTVNNSAIVQFTGTDTTARPFNLNSGSLTAAAGANLTLNGAAVSGGYLRGTGTFTATGGATLSGTSTFNSTVVNVIGAASFTNFSNGGALTVTAGPANPTSFNGFINQGSGAITVGAVSVVNVSDFQTYGTLTLNPAVVGSMTFTELVNTGSSPLYFNGGSRTFLGTPATANSGGSPSFVAGIDLHGQNLVIAGGLFVNNGFAVDSTGTPGSVIVDYGALYKGAGYTGVNVITQNGGKVQAGNSPGTASFGRFVFGPGGVSNYVFAIDDATGTAGPSPDASGHVSGWGLVKAIQQTVGSITSSGNFTWTATPADKLTVAIDTLVNPTTVGTDVAGEMADFDPTRAYSWPAAHWAGSYSGPTDAATLDAATAFDTSGFLNATAGTFGWSFDPAGQTLSLTYTPSSVPEPGTLVLVGLAAAGLAWRRKRGCRHFPAGPPNAYKCFSVRT